MEETLQGQLWEKKTYYGSKSESNFTLPGELTVTITLSEYRSLVEKSATTDTRIDEVRNSKYKLESEYKEKIKELTAENENLQRTIRKLINGDNSDEVE